MISRCFLVFGLVVVSLVAQGPYGRVTGRITDSAGAVVPGAAVKVTNLGTNVVTSTASDSQGNYEARNLIPGQYKLVVEMQGFRTYERGPIEVRVGDVLTVDAGLQLGVVSDSVTVTAEAPLLDSASASLGQVIDNRRVRDLPMPYANPMYLIRLATGIISTTAPTANWAINQPEGISGFSAAGAATSANEFTIDGAPNMLNFGNVFFQPSPEMVQEFRVETAPFDASVGHFTGALVSVVTKSGTNALHGTLNYGYNSRAFMTRQFFTNRQIHDTASGPVTQAKIDRYFPPKTLKRPRATVSGPVYIPKVYDGRNRTFFTYSFDQHLHDYVSNPNFKTVPTAAERNGDLSALLALGSRYQIYDPMTIAPAPGGRFSRQPLAGNIVPASRIDPLAKRLLEWYPLPNATGSADGLSNYFSSPLWHERRRNQIIRVDQVVSPNHRFFLSVMPTLEDTLWSSGGWDNDRLFQHQWVPGKNVTFDDVLTLRPDLVLNLRYGLTRVQRYSLPVSSGFDLTLVGLPASLANQIDRSITTFPVLSFDGVSSIGTTGTGVVTSYHSFAGNMAHNRSNHSLRFGGELRIHQNNSTLYGNASPALAFSNTWTRGPLDNSPAAPIGQDIATLLFGLPTGGGVDRNASMAQTSDYVGLFFQDDWKLGRRLTVNIGLRYELEVPNHERYNRTNRGFDFVTANPVQAAAQARYALSPTPEIPQSAFKTTGGLLFAGVNGAPRGLWESDRNNLAPRIGIAYQLRPTLVLRAGYGIFFEFFGGDRVQVVQQGFSQRTNLISSLDNGITFRAPLSNPFPDPLLAAPGASGGRTTFLGRSVTILWPDRKPGYVQRWSFNVQQELPSRAVVEVGYLGNRGTGLALTEDLNPVPAQYLSRSPVRDQRTIDYLSAALPNPFSPLPEFTGSSIAGQNVSRSQLLRPYPHFAGLSAALSAGFSWYHALEAKAERRFSRGFTIQASYTWAKAMEATSKLNPTDAWPTHAISTLDRPQRFVATGIYEMPFGKGKRFLSGSPGWVHQVVGAWSVQAIYQGQGGAALGFGNIIFNGNLHDIVLPRSQRKVERWFNIDAGFERDTQRQLGSNIRTFPLRHTGLRQDGHNSWDISVLKDVRITEKVMFQFRAEAQDALNHALFGAPNTTVTSTQFGQVTSTVGANQRVITLNGRLTW
ncbi:MAG: TonB-dependent receptor [Acidobacteriota bacterium]